MLGLVALGPGAVYTIHMECPSLSTPTMWEWPPTHTSQGRGPAINDMPALSFLPLEATEDCITSSAKECDSLNHH